MKRFNLNIIFWKGLLLALCMVLYFFPVKGFTYYFDGLYYDISSADNTAEVIRDQENNYSFISPDLTIPETISYNNRTYPVTAIGARAFEDVSTLSSIKLPLSITSIKEYAQAPKSKTKMLTSSDVGFTRLFECKLWKTQVQIDRVGPRFCML